MKNRTVNIAIAFFVLGMFGCSDYSPSETAAELKVKKYFDLKGFMDSEIERLDGNDKFKKTAYLNNEEETNETATINFEKELAIFSNADINRPAWSDKYTIDSVFNEKKELVRLAYETTDEKLRTQKISIELNKGVVTKIKINNQTSTSIADAQQVLTYEPANGYIIESRQQVMTADDAVLRIEVEF